MKYLMVLSLALGWSFAPQAHELDSETTVSPEQIKLAERLPQTVVIRVSKKDPTQVEVVHLKEKIPAGKKLDGLKFEKMALNAEKTGVAYDSSNEMDATSSTSSWLFGVGGFGGYGGYRRSYYGGYGYGRGYGGYGYGGYGNAGYGSGYGYNSGYGYGSGCGYSNYNNCGCYNNCNSAYYYTPRYSYAGYGYNYAPYYGYSDPYYNYSYCNWRY